MTNPTGVKHIVSDPEVFGGKPCIEGHRISVHDVAAWHHQGIEPESIAEDFDLTQAEVYAALAYYYDHQAEIDRDLAAEKAEIAQLAAEDTSPAAQRVRAKRVKRR
jgi:uncharacterized protein (DUF433 family)